MENIKLIYGIRPVLEALTAGKEIDKLFIKSGFNNEKITELIKLAQKLKIPVLNVPAEKLNRLTKGNHQGIVCIISPINFASLHHIIDETFRSAQNPLLLILDRITDVKNFGAIVRSAECAGVNAIIIPGKGSASINADAVKTSAGALNYLPVCRTNNLLSTIEYLKDSGLQVIACTENGDKYIYDTDFRDPVAIILGSEEYGIHPQYTKLADSTVKIPLSGKIGSLNVSVAAGIVIYEVVRQRIYNLG
ncbi:MAG: 23S rRNA (guanosine(2251)-2'-O)-methyltransferase RlmB [Cytophagales bacterium]|nr:23S rRNA (guanosine(2251)-2'-O)-methyltransferase RlmB [Cytophagales bacterium]